MRYLRLILRFMRASFQEEAAYRANFFINLLYSVLNLVTGMLGVMVLFGQVQNVQGWDLPSTLALLGVYLMVSALRGLFIGPGLEALAGMDGEIWSGSFDFTVLRPISTQFLVSLRKWRLFALFDLLLGAAVTGIAASMLGAALSAGQVLGFLLALLAGVLILYAFLLAFAALVFWSPGVLFTWIFDGILQMARYPLGMYPGWLRLVLTWIVPVGVITTVPAQALTGALTAGGLAAALGLALGLTLAASLLFRRGLRRYASASS
ncbi:MAG TPA: ABC-2 family transporter protein [Anaerolineaceae bacterium]|nr:ABC-2 family transporter protein [Anaerolineaceae bacterium]